MTRRDKSSQQESPATRLLDALRVGDFDGVLAQCGETTVVSADNMAWSCRGRHEIQRMLTMSRERFPGLTFESRTRHIGFGLVIDEARVQDDAFEGAPEAEAGPAEPEPSGSHAAPIDPSVHPMYDEPVAEKSTGLSPWKHRSGQPEPPIQLDMPVRVTVRHDDLQVHEVTLSFPAALLKRALGRYVDPFEMSLSQVQSAFIAPVGAGFTTYELARPELKLVPPPEPVTEPRWTEDQPPRRRRGRVLVPLLIALLAVLGGGAWYAVQGQDSGNQAATDVSGHTHGPKPRHSASPQSQPTATTSKAPTVTRGQPSNAPSRKPNVTLRSDLAFGFNSSTLSPEAKLAIQHVAATVRSAALTGKIYVDGYTDNLGSSAYGMVLSRRRADAVSNYLGSQLVGVSGITIVSIGHGEADPIADNSTAAGRQANRRVTITLPKP